MRKIFSLFAALTLSVGLWAEGSVFTYTATMKLAPYFNFLGDVATHEFNEQTGAGTVTYSSTVTEIGAYAFNECSPLQSITIPAGVTTIGTSAFTLCSSLQSITIPASVTTIGQGAFSTSGLTSITLPAGVTTIDLSTFFNCSSLESVTIPAGVTTIGDNAFTKCSSLQTITIPAGVATIGWNAFSECTGLTSVTFEGTACQNNIDEEAFYNVGKTTPATLVLPADWTGSKPADSETAWYGGYFDYQDPAPAIGDQFEDATSGLKFEVTATGETNTVMVITNGLETPYSGTTYTVPATVNYKEVDFAVTELGENAFSECSSLQSITLPEGLLTIGEGVFILCSSLQSITIPSSVTEIGKMAFNVCPALQSVTLSEGLLTIGQQAFGSCTSLQSITFPASVTEIGRVAFYGCSGLTSVTFLGNACQDAIGDIVFEGVGEDAPAALTLPANWTGSKPDEEGNWYGGKFELVTTALPKVDAAQCTMHGDKFMYNGQVILRSSEKNYTILGQGL